MSYLLRHHPDRGGITLDRHGWTAVGGLLRALTANGHELSFNDLLELVRVQGKGRFALSPGGDRIRANHGHSVLIDMDRPPSAPPSKLFHGTTERHIPVILIEGLKPMGRRHVHLSVDLKTATEMGARRGKPVLLLVDAQGMVVAGHSFYVRANGIWLTEAIPSQFVSLTEAYGQHGVP